MPNTDIYLIDFSYDNGLFDFGEPQNITNRDGYDNQPFFLPSEEGLFFSSDRTGGKTDIFLYNFQSQAITNVTRSPERAEYSPQVTADRKHFSVVTVEEDDSTQRIWKYQNPGKNPKIVWQDNKKVGYYCWIDSHQLATFVLGDSFTLHLYNRVTNESELIAGNIGRCLLPIPSMPGKFSYVSKRDTTNWTIRKYNPVDSTDNFIMSCVPNNEDYAWLTDGSLLMSGEGKLWHFRPKEDKEWREVANFTESIGDFYRLVVNPQMNKIAVVGFKGEKP